MCGEIIKIVIFFTKDARARGDGLKESETEKNRNKIYTDEMNYQDKREKREKRK